jgi:hypothetical protein
MTPLTVVLADIATLEAARDELPLNSHTAALISLTLYRLEEEADALRRAAFKRAAWPAGSGVGTRNPKTPINWRMQDRPV